jgi:hypothetical protein
MQERKIRKINMSISNQLVHMIWCHSVPEAVAEGILGSRSLHLASKLCRSETRYSEIKRKEDSRRGMVELKLRCSTCTCYTLVQFGRSSCNAFSFSLILSLLLYKCSKQKRSNSDNWSWSVKIYAWSNNLPFLKNCGTRQICFCGWWGE